MTTAAAQALTTAGISLGLLVFAYAIKASAYLVEAACLLGVVRRERIQHVHVHFGTNAASVALLMRRLGGPSYSIAIHGPGANATGCRAPTTWCGAR